MLSAQDNERLGGADGALLTGVFDPFVIARDAAGAHHLVAKAERGMHMLIHLGTTPAMMDFTADEARRLDKRCSRQGVKRRSGT